jgi:hypothetical protein
VPASSGAREVPQPRGEVWRGLAVLEPYCAVCDVSYLVNGTGVGSTFLCVPGRLDGEPAAGAPRGETLEWKPSRLVATRLELPAETWTTRIELADVEGGGTRVAMSLTLEPGEGNRLVRRLQRGTRQRLVRRTLDAELEKVPAHIAAGTTGGR